MERQTGIAKKKRYRGHFCKVCGQILANEKFSGKGHVAHICKTCAKKPKEQRAEEVDLTRIYGVYRYGNLSQNHRRMLENYSRSPRERVRSAALEVLATFMESPLSDEIEYFEEDCFDKENTDS